MPKSRYLSTLILIFLLTSCATMDRPVDDADTGAIDTIEAWQDEDRRHSAAVSALVAQADALIAQHRLRDAETVLNRSLRIDNRTATVWSRLAWLCLQNDCEHKARDYLTRSNSLTDASALLRFNWTLYREVSSRLGDSDGVGLAEQQLGSLPR